MGRFPNMTELQMRMKQEQQIQDERKRDNIIRIACAILSGKSGLVNLDDVVEKATEIYNKIDAKL